MEEGMEVVAVFLTSFLLNLALQPLIIKLSFKYNFLDYPGERKIHKKPVPTIGGVGIYLSIALSLVLIYYLKKDVFFLKLLLPLTVIHIVGVIDDILKLNFTYKFLAQIIVALIAYYFLNTKIVDIANPFGEGRIYLGGFSVVITVLWMVFYTNAINLIDGLDGLAAGISGIAGVTLASIAIIKGNLPLFLVNVSIVAACAAFLFYNFSPAKVFMGDSGSMMLGFILSVLGIKVQALSSSTISMMVPVMAAGVPFFDTVYSFFRRLKSKRNPFKGDREHLHHQLITIGLSHRTAVLILYLISAIFCLISTVLFGFLDLVLLTVYLMVFGIGFSFLTGIKILKFQVNGKKHPD